MIKYVRAAMKPIPSGVKLTLLTSAPTGHTQGNAPRLYYRETFDTCASITRKHVLISCEMIDCKIMVLSTYSYQFVKQVICFW